MPKGFGDLVFRGLTASPAVHRFINRMVVSSFADRGPLPGLYSTGGPGRTQLWEMIDKDYFSLEVPTPPPEETAGLPEIEALLPLFKREGSAPESRVSVLLPFFAQHLTDAVFQSDGQFGTSAPHEIILNQIYGNTRDDEALLRSGEGGRLRTQIRRHDGREAEYPDALCEQRDGAWVIRDRYVKLSYLQAPGRVEALLERYAGREGDLCATGLFQGNMTLGNFAITVLLVREHNRLCAGIVEERRRKGLPADDETVFRIAQQNNITAYLKVVIEDYINAFAGQKIFILDTKSFFHEGKRWCRDTPIPYHFNILYRLHSMMPDSLKGFEDRGFAVMRANNDLVMERGLGEIFDLASRQRASRICLGNTHPELLPADRAGLEKTRRMLGFFNAHREVQELGSAVGFDAFDPAYRDQLEALYGDPDRVEYAVGVLAELPAPGWAEKLGLKDDPIIGPTLMRAIAKHALRHILSNRFMTREFLNREVLGDFGWESLHATSGVADIVRRNLSGEMDQARADALRIGFTDPD